MENKKTITSNIIAMLSSIGALLIGCGATCGTVCAVPLLSFIGVSGATLSELSWLDKFQPYLMGLTILSLGYGFYQAYRPVKEQDCDDAACVCPPTKRNFFKSKFFLWVATIFCLFLWTYPLFFSTNKSSCENTNVSCGKAFTMPE